MNRFEFFLGYIHLFCSYIHVCFLLVAFIGGHIWHKVLLMGYSVGLQLSHICSLNGFQLVMSLYIGHSSLFLKVCLPLIYLSIYLSIYLYIYIYIYEFSNISINFIHIDTWGLNCALLLNCLSFLI